MANYLSVNVVNGRTQHVSSSVARSLVDTVREARVGVAIRNVDTLARRRHIAHNARAPRNCHRFDHFLLLDGRLRTHVEKRGHKVTFRIVLVTFDQEQRTSISCRQNRNVLQNFVTQGLHVEIVANVFNEFEDELLLVQRLEFFPRHSRRRLWRFDGTRAVRSWNR